MPEVSDLKRCGARKDSTCPCRQEWSTWRRGDPLAGLPAAPVWEPRRTRGDRPV